MHSLLQIICNLCFSTNNTLTLYYHPSGRFGNTPMKSLSGEFHLATPLLWLQAANSPKKDLQVLQTSGNLKSWPSQIFVPTVAFQRHPWSFELSLISAHVEKNCLLDVFFRSGRLCFLWFIFRTKWASFPRPMGVFSCPNGQVGRLEK